VQNKMLHECCAKQKIRFEIESWYKDLKDDEKLVIEISNCKVLKGTKDLLIYKQGKEETTA